MMLAPPDSFTATRRADVRLTLLASAPRPLRNRSRVHFHSNTMEAVAEIALHNAKELAPGKEAFARLKLPEAALLLPGDRFIIRQFSPVITIGGGTVVDAAPIPRQPDLADFLQTLSDRNRESVMQRRIQRRARAGISLAQLVAETGWRAESIQSALAPTFNKKQAHRAGDIFIDGVALAALRAVLLEAVASFQKKNSLSPGMAKEELREQGKASPEVFAAALDQLAREQRIEIAGDIVRLPGHGVTMKDEEAESKKKIEDAFAAAGLKVPALHEVLSGLKIDKVRAQKIVTLLLREKSLIKISDDLVFHRTALEQLRRQIGAHKTKSPTIDVAAFKDMTGVSRKYAIPLLEYLDRERVTKRVGDSRHIL
jgi:selenocysteine-specific elongation factor